jgi:hypothetical protein
MKRDQVPQDDANLMEGRSREVCYAVDEEGDYVRVLSTGWEPKNTALLQAWEQIDEQAKEAYRLVRAGRVSPLAFFMAKYMFDVKLLSEYTNIPKRKIKKHLDPEQFRRLDHATLAKYADAFSIEPAELVRWQMQTASSFHADGEL